MVVLGTLSSARVAYSIALTVLSAIQAIVQLFDSLERVDTVLSKLTGMGFESVRT